MKKTTQELLDLLKKSPAPSDFLEQEATNLIPEVPLSSCLLHLLEERGLSKSDLIHASGIDKGYAYEIFSGKKRPSRDKLLTFCFALGLSFDEVQHLFQATAYPSLYARFERDSVIIFALQHHLSLIDVNELLYEMNFELLS